MGDNGLNLALTFKVWNIIDGFMSLVLLFPFLLVSAAIEKYKIK